MQSNPELARRYAGARTLDDDGAASPRELLAYRIVGPRAHLDETLGAGPAPDWIGDAGDAIDPVALTATTLLLVAVPGLGLVQAAVAPFLHGGRHRSAILHALGAPASTRAAAAVVPAVVAGVPGAALGPIAWLGLGGRLTEVPFVGRQVFTGDLAIDRPQALLACGAAVATLVASAAARSARAPLRRPAARCPTRPPAARLLPAAAGLSLMAVAAFVVGPQGARLFVAGLTAVVLGSIIGHPVLISAFGRALAARPRLGATLLGRRLAWDAARADRPLAALCALATLVPVGAAWVAINRTVDLPTSGRSYAVVVRGPLRDRERARLATRAGAVAAQVMADGEELALLVDCAALDRSGFGRCRSGRLVPTPGRGLAEFDGVRVGPRPHASQAPDGTLFLAADGRRAESTMRRWAIHGDRPDRQVLAPGRVPFQESPLVGWLLGSFRLAALLGGAALGLRLSAAATADAGSRRLLDRLGADHALVGRIAGAEAAASVGLAGGGSLAVGMVAAGLFVARDPTAAFPIAPVLSVATAVCVLVITVGLAATTALRVGTRADRRD